MANNALKKLLKTDLIQMIKNGLTNEENYYLFVSRATPYEDDPNTASVVESDTTIPSVGDVARNVYDTLRNTIFIKRIQPDNIKLVIPRVNWATGTTYTAYSETTDMSGKTFYVLTSDYNVYKCISAYGRSTVMPTGKSSDIISTADGYKWKYLYTIPEDYLGFLTREYMPVYIASPGEADRVEQRLVQSRAVPGSIDSVSVTASLSPTFNKAFANKRFFTNGYNSQLETNHGIVPNVAGSSYIAFDPTTENQNAGTSYWNDYAVHVTDGAGVGQYFRILSFIKAGGAGNSYYYAEVYPQITRSFSYDDATRTQFKIVPYMVVDGDGENAIVAPILSNLKKLTSLSVLNPGKNYTYANPRIVSDSTSATIGSSITTLNSSMSANLSIPGGHGFNAIEELGAADVMMVMEVDGLEADDLDTQKITARNDYRQFGILKNPYLQGGLTLAGDDREFEFKMIIKKQPSKSNFVYGANTFVKDNYIIGAETKATAKISDSYRIPGSEFHRIDLVDVVGNFRFSDDSSLRSRVYFASGFTGTFVTGANAFQYEGTIGLTTSAEGKVVTFDMYERSLLIDCTKGAFVEGKTITFSSGSTLSAGSIVDVDEEYGEIIKQFSAGATAGSTFLTFGGDENFGRVASTRLDRIDIENVGEYRTTTRLRIVTTGSAFTDGVLSGSAYDGTIKQTNSRDLKMTLGTIVDFYVPTGSGNTGTLSLSNVRGTFNTVDPLYFIPYGSTAETAISATINQLVPSEIKIGSGDMLYIENVRPIQRNIEQSEEFKIVIGF